MGHKLEKWKKEFLILWSGQAVSILTSAIIQMAIIWYLIDKTGSAAVLTFATLIGYLPQAIIGTFAGVFIDRYNRKKIMIISDASIAILTFSLVIVGSFGDIPVWFIMLVLFGRSIGSAFHNPSLHAITPLIVPKDNLTKYAGYSQGFTSMSYLISPAIAALLYSMWDLHIIVFLDIIGAAFAIVMLLFIKIPDIRKSESEQKTGYFSEFKEGVNVLRKKHGMMTLVVVDAIYAIIYFPMGNLYPLITMTYFKGNFFDSSVVEIVFSLGSFLGSFLLGVIGSKINKSKSLGRSIVVYGIGLLIIGMLPSSGFKIFAVISGIMGASVPFFTGVKTSIFQMKFESEYLGRVLSLTSSLTMFAMPIGLVLAGAFAEVIGVERWFFISGVATMFIALFTMFAPSLRNCADEDID